jgi:hypothetical protein
MGMLNKLFNSKNKYYLELEEVKDSKPVQAVVLNQYRKQLKPKTK